MQTKSKNILYIGFITVLALTQTSCESKSVTNQTTETPSNNEGYIQSVEVVKPLLRTFEAEVLITGTAQANQKVILYAMESGYVQNISKNIGDFVRKGETIAVLRNPEMVQLSTQKKIQRDAKKVIADRLAGVQAKTPALTTLEMVEQAQMEYLTLEAECKAIQERMHFLTVRAPFSGRITKRMVDNGALVQQGLTQSNPQGIVEIQETNTIRLAVPFPEADIAGVNKNMPVTVTFPELSGKAFEAKISRIAGALDPASKTMMAEIDIKNDKGTIKPGMYAKVSMLLNSREGVLSLPLTAQVIHQNTFFVLVVKDGIVQRIPLRKGLASKDYFEILNADITKDALIIIQGKGLVNEGQTVKAILKNNGK